MTEAKGRERWLELLEVVAKCPPDEAEAEWRWLMQELGLGPEYFLAVLEAVRQGRWRQAKDPRAYVKTVAKREALQMGIGEAGEAAAAESDELVLIGGAEVAEERFSGEEMLEALRYQQDIGRPVKGTDGVWRPGGGFGPDLEDPRGKALEKIARIAGIAKPRQRRMRIARHVAEGACDRGVSAG